MFRFFCSECNNKLKAPESLVGKKVECAHCNVAIVVPAPDQVDAKEAAKKSNMMKTQQLTRKALVDHSTILEPEGSGDIVDMINKQVEAEAAATTEEDDSSEPAPPKPAIPKQMSIAEPVDPVPSSKVAEPVNTETLKELASSEISLEDDRTDEEDDPAPHKVAEKVNTEQLKKVAGTIEDHAPHKVAEKVNTEQLKKVAGTVEDHAPQKVAEKVNTEQLKKVAGTVEDHAPHKVAEPVNTEKLKKETASAIMADDEDEDEQVSEDTAVQHDTSPDEDIELADPIPTNYPPGMVVGNFEIGYLLGKGAMGQVFAAKQLSMDRQVALKVLPPEVMNEEAVQQFNNEVRMLAKLTHQNIVTAYEAGEDKGIYYLAMAFIEGMTLDDVLEKEGPVPEVDAINLVIYIANALKYAWDQFNMLHLDVKPANIMIDSQGTVKLMDLGIAKISTGKEGRDNLEVLGTPRYMSPEQALGEADLDWRSDQYSLGCTLYHMLTGEVPFSGDDPKEVMSKHISAPIRPVVSLNKSISKEVNDVVKRMLAKDRKRRFESWDDLISRLGEISHKLSLKKNLKGNKATGNMPAKKKKSRRTRANQGVAASYANPKQGNSLGKVMVLFFIILAGMILIGLAVYLNR